MPKRFIDTSDIVCGKWCNTGLDILYFALWWNTQVIISEGIYLFNVYTKKINILYLKHYGPVLFT